MFNYEDLCHPERDFKSTSRNVCKMTYYTDRYIEMELLLSYLDGIDQFLPLTGWWPPVNGAIRSTKEHEAFYSALRDGMAFLQSDRLYMMSWATSRFRTMKVTSLQDGNLGTSIIIFERLASKES